MQAAHYYKDNVPETPILLLRVGKVKLCGRFAGRIVRRKDVFCLRRRGRLIGFACTYRSADPAEMGG